MNVLIDQHQGVTVPNPVNPLPYRDLRNRPKRCEHSKSALGFDQKVKRERRNGVTVNREKIVLRMDANEADKVAFVLMTALVNVSMLDSERKVTTNAVNALFKELDYTIRTDANGNRIQG